MRIDELRDRLRISKHLLDDELELQPVGAGVLADHVADLGRAAALAKENLAQAEARLSLDYRAAGDKLPEKQLSDKVTRAPERQTAMRAYLDAKRDHEVALGLQEAWRQRGFALKNLAELHGADYYSQTSTGDARGGRDRAISQQRERAALRHSVNSAGVARTRVKVDA